MAVGRGCEAAVRFLSPEDQLEGVDERQREAKAERSSGFNSSAVPSSGSLAIRQQEARHRAATLRAVLAGSFGTRLSWYERMPRLARLRRRLLALLGIGALVLLLLKLRRRIKQAED